MYILLISFLPSRLRDKYRQGWHEIKLRNVIFWGKAIRVFRKPKFPDNSDASICLHLGCGKVYHPSFVNIDAVPASHIHYVRPIDNLSIFGDETVDLIYACHCLEHFSHRVIYRIISEWYRVLKVGGTLRLSVPDFDKLLDIYNKNSNEIDIITDPLLGSHANSYDIHKAVFNERKLNEVFMRAGFSQTRNWVPGSEDLTTFDDWSSRRIHVNGKDYPVSLNMEGVK